MNHRFLVCMPLFVSLLAVSGCATWRAESGGVRPGLLDSHPRVLRVTLRGRRLLVLHAPRLEADSLIGFVTTREPAALSPAGNLLGSKPTERVGVALADIASVETRKTDFTIVWFGLVPILSLVAIVGMIELSHATSY